MKQLKNKNQRKAKKGLRKDIRKIPQMIVTHRIIL